MLKACCWACKGRRGGPAERQRSRHMHSVSVVWAYILFALSVLPTGQARLMRPQQCTQPTSVPKMTLPLRRMRTPLSPTLAISSCLLGFMSARHTVELPLR